MFQRIFFGLIGMVLSFLIIKYRKQIYDIVGSVDMAEKYLGRGGTILFFTLFGIFVFILSLMYMTGTLDTFLFQSAGKFFGK